jgi:hypothetical protein
MGRQGFDAVLEARVQSMSIPASLDLELDSEAYSHIRGDPIWLGSRPILR